MNCEGYDILLSARLALVFAVAIPLLAAGLFCILRSLRPAFGRMQRALDRERSQARPKYAELCRRFLADEADFSEEKIRNAGIRRRFENVGLQACMEEIRAYIRSEINE